MKKTPVKGTRDYLPKEAALRAFMQQKILETYSNAGFNQVVTPILEDLQNLQGSEGGDNLNLLFKIMKRGEKLDSALAAKEYGDLADLGLRYDLTLPLTRYFAANKEKLVLPAKCIQIGNAYRAENPQKGRYREFMQCDIDTIGLSSYWAEVELILTTGAALRALDITGFKIKVNDRRILTQLFLAFGFDESAVPGLCIVFDKMDKIGPDGVEKELAEKGFAEGPSAKLIEYIRRGDFSMEECINRAGESEAMDNIKAIINAANNLAAGAFESVFDISLVRGQGYYTGAVFEIESLEYSGSLGGGGRYDTLIGKFIGENVPAVGFSIGFERIFDILMKKNAQLPGQKKRVAVMFETGYEQAYSLASTLREEYDVSIFERPKKLKAFLEKLEQEGYSGFTTGEDGGKVNFFKG